MSTILVVANSIFISMLIYAVMGQQEQQTSKGVYQTVTNTFIREDCKEAFAKFDFNYDCVKYSLTKLVGYLIIFFSSIGPVPQLMKIVELKSTEGMIVYASYWMVRVSILNVSIVHYSVNPIGIQHFQGIPNQCLRRDVHLYVLQYDYDLFSLELQEGDHICP